MTIIDFIRRTLGIEKPKQEKKPDNRIAAMLEMRKQGKRLQEIGDAFGITRERVRQLIGTQYRPQLISERLREIKEPARQAWRSGMTKEQICDLFNVNLDQLRRIKLGTKPLPLLHGTIRGYRRGCKCDECRAANAAYYLPRQRRIWEKLKSAGLCIRCKQPSAGYAVCLKCQPAENPRGPRKRAA